MCHSFFFCLDQQISTHIICSLWIVSSASLTMFRPVLTFRFCCPLSSLCHLFFVTMLSPKLSILEMRYIILHRSYTLFGISYKKTNTHTKTTDLHHALCGSFHSMAGVSRLCLVILVSMEGYHNKCQFSTGTFFLLKQHTIASLCDLNLLEWVETSDWIAILKCTICKKQKTILKFNAT